MADFLFVLRTFAVTVGIFLLMQIRVGTATVEQHTVAVMHSSTVVDTLQNVADGAVHIFHLGAAKAQGVGSKLFGRSANSAGDREFKRRAQKRAETKRAISKEAERIEAPTDRIEAPTPAAPAEPYRGSFRSFFDVKSVHDSDSN